MEVVILEVVEVVEHIIVVYKDRVELAVQESL